MGDTGFVQHIVARCYFETSNYQRAVEVYAHCCERHKLHRPLGLEYYSTALWHLGEAVELTKLAQSVLEWDRLRPEVWCVVGNCFSLQREHEQAVRSFRRAIQIDPSFVYAHTLIAHEYADSDKFDKAIQIYERAISIDSRHYNAWWGLGHVHLRQEQYLEAKIYFQRAVNINKGNAVLRASLGMACEKLGETEAALEFFSDAARSKLCSVLASYHKGIVLVSMGRSEEAINELKHAQSLAPREPAVHFQLGQAHAGVGDLKRGLYHFTMAMDLCGAKDSKDHQMIVAAQAKLLRATSNNYDERLMAPPVPGMDIGSPVPGEDGKTNFTVSCEV